MTHHILLIGDTHGGHTHGLMSPNVELQQETETGEIVTYTPQLRAVQDWLWHDVYMPGIEQVQALTRNDPLTVIHMGDVTHGVRRMQELVTTEMDDQLEIACANFAPILGLPNLKRLEIVIGTGSHEMESGAAARAVKRMMATRADIPIEAVFHILAEVDGCTIDAAHHGPPPGSRSWLSGNVARFYLRDRLMSEAQPATAYLRAHYHTPIWERITDEHWRDHHLIITPPLCTPGAWTRQATRSVARISCGMVLLTLDKGRITPTKLTQSVDLRSKRAW